MTSTNQVHSEQPAGLDQVTSLMEDITAKTKIFQWACTQVLLLNHKVEDAIVRYDRARSNQRLSFRYSNRMKLNSLEEVRGQIYNYAVEMLQELERLEEELRQLINTMQLE